MSNNMWKILLGVLLIVTLGIGLWFVVNNGKNDNRVSFIEVQAIEEANGYIYMIDRPDFPLFISLNKPVDWEQFPSEPIFAHNIYNPEICAGMASFYLKEHNLLISYSLERNGEGTYTGFFYKLDIEKNTLSQTKNNFFIEGKIYSVDETSLVFLDSQDKKYKVMDFVDETVRTSDKDEYKIAEENYEKRVGEQPIDVEMEKTNYVRNILYSETITRKSLLSITDFSKISIWDYNQLTGESKEIFTQPILSNGEEVYYVDYRVY